MVYGLACLLEVWKILNYEMHHNVDVEHSVSVQRQHNRESAADIDC